MRISLDFSSGIMMLVTGGVLSLEGIISDDIIICFALATLGAFGALGLAKNTRHMVWEGVAGVCIGTGGGWILLRMNAGTPFPELTAFLLGIGGLMVPIVIRQNIGAWILEIKERFFPSKDKKDKEEPTPPATTEPGEPPVVIPKGTGGP